jgi:predicted short-subunit dehydrogenase-like oxidoreductase (DUF2520 family)
MQLGITYWRQDMKVGFIGAGKAGLTIGTYWLTKSVEVLGYYSLSIHSAEKAATNTNTRIFTSLSALAVAADLIMITTPDDAIQIVGETLSGISLDWDNKIVCHMSGVHSSDILIDLYNEGATVCSLHPMISFGNALSTVQILEHTFYTLEGKGKQITDFEKFLQQLGQRYEYINSDQKALYHAAACILSNYFVALLDTGIQILRHSGFSEQNILNCMKPLIEKTWENVLAEGTGKALTGPISRGDVGTIHIHRQKILEQDRQDWLEVYEVMGKRTVQLAVQAGKIDQETANSLLKEL